jgi:hypothetical protein
MTETEIRIRAYELALLTAARQPGSVSADDVLHEAMKIERWLNAPYAAQQNTHNAKYPYTQAHQGGLGPQPPMPAPAPKHDPFGLNQNSKPIKKADW